VCNGTSSTAVASQGVRIGFAGTTTWTCPAGVTQITVELWGGGGGSGVRCYKAGSGPGYAGSCDYGYSGGNGGNGGYIKAILSVTSNQNYSIVIGDGGAAAYTNPYYKTFSCTSTLFNGGGIGGNGEVSSFGVLLTANYGTGGTSATPTYDGANGSNGSIVNYDYPILNYGTRSYMSMQYLTGFPTGVASGAIQKSPTNSISGCCDYIDRGSKKGEAGYCVISY
jgi:hypothetical protein